MRQLVVRSRMVKVVEVGVVPGHYITQHFIQEGYRLIMAITLVIKALLHFQSPIQIMLAVVVVQEL